MPRRVGLLGGTFDPPHLGHLVVADEARHAYRLDEVRFTVAGRPWMKPGTTPAEHRAAMARLAAATDPAFVVDTNELARDGPTYTVDTLESLHRDEPDTEWFFLVGVDAAAKIDRWHRADDALALATFVIVSRPGYPEPLPSTVEGRVERLAVTEIGVSSTLLRERFAQGGSTRFLVPDAVGAYVLEHGLYGAA